MINEDIIVTEYSPDVFAFLRALDGYNNDILRESLNPEANRKMVFKAGESQGKSGSFFFFSKDQRFIIKTMTESDFNAFMRIQKHYFKHVATNDGSLLARVYGVYSVHMEDQKPVKLIVMENGIRGATRDSIVGVFDLKGSMVNRIVKGSKLSATATLKDRNLLKMNQEQIWLRFSQKDRHAILKAMQSDVHLLQKYNLMDYSLLLCIQANPDFKRGKRASNNETTQSVRSRSSVDSDMLRSMRLQFQGSRHKFLSACCQYIYHIGIIDYLQDYNLDKQLENFAKYTVLMKGDGISAVPPPAYSQRFLRFMRDHVIIDQKEEFKKKKDPLNLSRRTRGKVSVRKN